MRQWLKRIRRYRWAAWTIAAVGAVLRLAWFIFSHYAWLWSLAVMAGAIWGQFYSPHITDALIAGLLAFTSIRILGWHSKLAWEAAERARIAAQPKPTPPATKPQTPTQITSRLLSNKMVGADYYQWDLVDEFTLQQAALLWVGYDPSTVGSVVAEAYPVIVALKQAAKAGKLSVDGFVPETAQLFYTTWQDVSDDARVNRTDLVEYAKSKGKRPDFLFPDERMPF